jgi:hypothetical protein
MTLPPSYTRFALQAAINAYRDHLANDPSPDVALRLQRLLLEAQAELSHLEGLTNGKSVDGRSVGPGGESVAPRVYRRPNRQRFGRARG